MQCSGAHAPNCETGGANSAALVWGYPGLMVNPGDECDCPERQQSLVHASPFGVVPARGGGLLKEPLS